MPEIYEIQNGKTFCFSAENRSGKKGGGPTAGDCLKVSPIITVPPGATVILAEGDGEGLIEHMWFTGRLNHQMIIRMYWDWQDYPSVEVPLTSFFGMTYYNDFENSDGGYTTLNSSQIMVAPARGCNSYIKMPFKKHFIITLENRAPEGEFNIYYSITGMYCKMPEEVGYFHASYRQEHPITAGKSYTVIDGIKGKGHFLGMTLCAKMNNEYKCWVEGETRMFIDGDTMPSIHYTGTEDYFGGSYAFGRDIALHKYETFQGLYSGVNAIIGKEPVAGQKFLLYRWHVADPICFDEDFRMTMDNLGEGCEVMREDDYSSVAYWYQTLPGAPLNPLPSFEDLNPYK